MNPAQVQRFVRSWFSEWVPDPPDFGPATRQLAELIDHEPEQAWALILALVEHASNEYALDMVAAGPLEDLICEHGLVFINRIEELAATNQRFKNCLSYVWGSNRLEASIYARMRKAAGEETL